MGITNQELNYNVDIVMCIDGTRSMDTLIKKVKANALNFPKLLLKHFEEDGKPVAELRVKVIVFRDYGCDTQPKDESEFFNLTGQDGDDEKFKEFVNSIKATGGGDGPQNALEAFSLALKYDWTTGGTNRRHVILMFTNSPALRLGERTGTPEGMPKDFEELAGWWENGLDDDSTYQPMAGRLVAFVPAAWPWSEITSWKRCWLVLSGPETGVEDVEGIFWFLSRSEGRFIIP